MSNMQILEASEVNVNDYRRLRLEALREEPQAFGSAYNEHIDLPITEWQKWLLNYIEGNDNWMIFATSDSKLVGMVGAYLIEGDCKDKSAQIIAMYVTEEMRGRGISKLLMQNLLQKLANEALIKEVVLEVNVEQAAAVSLYKSMGFNTIKNSKIILGDGKEHEIYMMTKAL